MHLLGIIFIGVLLALGAYKQYSRRAKTHMRKHMRDLVRACHNDSELAERLVFAELSDMAQPDIGEAARRAQRRLERERAR